MYPAQCYQCNARYRDPWQIHKAKYEHQDTKISTQPWSLGLNIACRLDIYAFVAPAQFRAPSTTHLISLTHGKHQQLHGRVTNNSRRRKAPDSQLKSVHALMNAMKYFLGCPIKISYHPRQCAEHYTIIHTNHALFSRHIYIYIACCRSLIADPSEIPVIALSVKHNMLNSFQTILNALVERNSCDTGCYLTHTEKAPH
jgi:hypothetical protein